MEEETNKFSKSSPEEDFPGFYASSEYLQDMIQDDPANSKKKYPFKPDIIEKEKKEKFGDHKESLKLVITGFDQNKFFEAIHNEKETFTVRTNQNYSLNFTQIEGKDPDKKVYKIRVKNGGIKMPQKILNQALFKDFNKARLLRDPENLYSVIIQILKRIKKFLKKGVFCGFHSQSIFLIEPNAEWGYILMLIPRFEEIVFFLHKLDKECKSGKYNREYCENKLLNLKQGWGCHSILKALGDQFLEDYGFLDQKKDITLDSMKSAQAEALREIKKKYSARMQKYISFENKKLSLKEAIQISCNDLKEAIYDLKQCIYCSVYHQATHFLLGLHLEKKFPNEPQVESLKKLFDNKNEKIKNPSTPTEVKIIDDFGITLKKINQEIKENFEKIKLYHGKSNIPTYNLTDIKSIDDVITFQIQLKNYPIKYGPEITFKEFQVNVEFLEKKNILCIRTKIPELMIVVENYDDLAFLFQYISEREKYFSIEIEETRKITIRITCCPGFPLDFFAPLKTSIDKTLLISFHIYNYYTNIWLSSSNKPSKDFEHYECFYRRIKGDLEKLSEGFKKDPQKPEGKMECE